MHTLLTYISAHPDAALAVIFLISFLESVAFIGTVMPAGIVLFTGGALVGADALNLWTTLGLATLGAILGDGFSYELGYRHAGRVRNWPLARRYAGVVQRGEQFIHRYGGKSILFARFIAPVRAVVPVLAGIATMPRLRFYVINALSAAVWAPVHILPGVLFGASIRVAEAVTARLALLLLLVAGLTWLAIRLVRITTAYMLPLLAALRYRAVRWAAPRHGFVARGVMFFLDPDKPESEVLLISALLLLASGWLFLGVIEDVITHDRLVQVDVAVFHFFQSLRTSVADQVMLVITELGGAAIVAPLTLLVFAWLLLRRNWHNAAYWAAAVLFSQLLVKLLKITLGRARPFDVYSGHAIEQFSFPSGHATTSMVVYGFLAFLLTRGQTRTVRIAVAAGATVLITLIGLSRLYLGAHWLSDVVGGFSLGLAWITLLAIVHTHHQVREALHPKQLGAVLAVSLAGYAPWYMATHLAQDVVRYTPVPHEQILSVKQWTDGGWKQLPQQRREIAGQREERFRIQWAGDASIIAQALTAAGWRQAPQWSLSGALTWLTPGVPLTQLPVLPKFNRGSGSDLAFVQEEPGVPTARRVLRLWRSNFMVRENGIQQAVPLWYGAVYQEDFRRPWGLATMYRTRPGSEQELLRTTPDRPAVRRDETLLLLPR